MRACCGMFSFATNSRPLATSSFGTCTAVEPDHRTRSRIQYDDYVWFDTQYNQETHTIGIQRHCCQRYGIMQKEQTAVCTNTPIPSRLKMTVDLGRVSDKYKENSLSALRKGMACPLFLKRMHWVCRHKNGTIPL